MSISRQPRRSQVPAMTGASSSLRRRGTDMSAWHPIRTALFASTALIPLGLAVAIANPLGPTVVGGTATVTGVNTPKVTVTQTTPNAAINWQTFNVGVGERVQFVQPSATSIALNRVTSPGVS